MPGPYPKTNKTTVSRRWVLERAAGTADASRHGGSFKGSVAEFLTERGVLYPAAAEYAAQLAWDKLMELPRRGSEYDIAYEALSHVLTPILDDKVQVTGWMRGLTLRDDHYRYVMTTSECPQCHESPQAKRYESWESNWGCPLTVCWDTEGCGWQDEDRRGGWG